MKKILLSCLTALALILPLSASAQIFTQRQLITTPFGNDAVVVSTSTANGGYLAATTSPSLLTVSTTGSGSSFKDLKISGFSGLVAANPVSGLLYSIASSTLFGFTPAPFPFTAVSYGVSTTSTVGFLGGLISVGSTTISSLGTGFVQSTNGLLSSASLTSGNITTALGFTPVTNARNLTVAGTANQISCSGGAQDLSADRTWTCSIPQNFLFPLSYTSTFGTTTYASSTVTSSTGSAYFATGGGNVGIGATSTPGSLLSINGVANFTTGTSTFYGNGLNIPSSQCYAIGGTCLTAGSIGGGTTQAVNWATTAVLAGTPTYSNGASGVGATLTEVGSGALSVDGNAPAAGDRVLVKNQASALQNGIYGVTATGSGIASYVLTRATDYNTPSEITPGINTYVLSGTANTDTTWAVSYTPPLAIGTNALTYTESAGTGGTVTSVAASVPSFLSISGSPITTSGTLAISYSGTALPVANGGTGQTTFTSSQVIYGNGTTGFASVGTTTLSGTANQLNVSNSPVVIGSSGAVFSLPNHVIFPFDFLVTNSSTTNATTTGSSYFTGITASRPLYIDSTGKLTSAGTGVSGNCVNWGANNTFGDAGAACGSGTGTGLGTTSPISAGNLLEYSSAGAGSAFGVATSTLSPSSPLTGSFTQIGSGGSLGIQAASASQNGYLSQGDFSLLHTATTTFTAPLTYTLSTNAVTCAAANGSTNGCLSSTDWNTFNNKTSWPFTINAATVFYGALSQSTTTQVHFAAAGYSLTASTTAAFNIINTGSSTATVFADAPLVVAGNNANYTQIVCQNLSNGVNASCDLSLHADIGNDSTYYHDVGINSSGYSQASQSSENLLDSFDIASDNALVIGTASTTNTLADIRFVAGGTASSSIKMIIKPTGKVGIGTTSPEKTFMVEGTDAGGIARFQRDFAASVNQVVGTQEVILNETTGTQDLTGPAQTFNIRPAGGTVNPIGDITAIREGADNTGKFQIRAYNAGTPLAVFTARNNFQGNAGIGTSTPYGALDVASNGTFASMPQLVISDAGAGVNLKHWYASTTPEGGLSWGRLTDTSAGIYTTATQIPYLTFGASGFIGIGTTTPIFSSLVVASTTGTQVALSAGAGVSQWTMRNSFGVLYYATTTITGTMATSSAAALSINLNGGISIPAIGACSGSSALITSAAGLISCGAITATGDGVGTWFTPTNVWGTANASATSTIIFDSAGLFASSTVRFGNQGLPGFNWNGAGGWLSIGTTTQTFANLTLASSTQYELALGDNSLTSAIWTFRSVGNNFYMASASPVTFSTTTISAFTILNSGAVGFGTSSPVNGLDYVAASTTAGTANDGYRGTIGIIAGFENTVVKLFQVFDSWGRRITSGDAPVLSSCGGSPSFIGSANDNTMSILVGTSVNACTATFAHAWPTAPTCVVSNRDLNPSNPMTYTVSATAVVISQTTLGGSHIDIQCTGTQ